MLTIDTREDSRVANPVKKLFEEAGIPVQIKKMEYGDFRFDLIMEDGSKRVVVIERKTPGDFINSTNATIKEPATKMARQLNGCVNETGADEVLLLIDGPWYPLRGGRIKTGKMTLRASVDGFAGKLRTIQGHGIRIEFNPAEWYLANYLLALYKYETKLEHATLSLSAKSFSLPSKEEAKWTVLMGIKGVGPIMARELMNEFGSVQAIANANAKELSERVKGVGLKTAEQILWYLQ